jgi:hypothetical protein
MPLLMKVVAGKVVAGKSGGGKKWLRGMRLLLWLSQNNTEMQFKCRIGAQVARA